MNNLSIFTLKALRKLYAKTIGGYQLPPLQREEDPDKASEMIYNLLSDDKPCMIARFGANELNAIINYLGVNAKNHSIWEFIQGKQSEWWWNKNIMHYMQNNAGFFPATPENMQRFGEMMIEDAKEVDLLGSWLNEEKNIINISSTKMVALHYLEPFWSKQPWTRILANKKVLVVHPFNNSIYNQYIFHRKVLFKNPNILPDFELKVIPAVQSLGGVSQYSDWFSALDSMKTIIDSVNFDICLLGCGAYGFPLAAHIKRIGKKSIHLGGSLQLLFGIKGKRWVDKEIYSQIMNENWIYPTSEEKPKTALNVEGGCYW